MTMVRRTVELDNELAGQSGRTATARKEHDLQLVRIVALPGIHEWHGRNYDIRADREPANDGAARRGILRRSARGSVLFLHHKSGICTIYLIEIKVLAGRPPAVEPPWVNASRSMDSPDKTLAARRGRPRKFLAPFARHHADAARPRHRRARRARPRFEPGGRAADAARARPSGRIRRPSSPATVNAPSSSSTRRARSNSGRASAWCRCPMAGRSSPSSGRARSPRSS